MESEGGYLNTEQEDGCLTGHLHLPAWSPAHLAAANQTASMRHLPEQWRTGTHCTSLNPRWRCRVCRAQ